MAVKENEVCCCWPHTFQEHPSWQTKSKVRSSLMPFAHECMLAINYNYLRANMNSDF